MVQTAGAENVSDVYYTGHFSTKAPANDKVEPFVEAFKAKYSKEPSAFNALAYDAVYMIKQAIEDQDSADSTAIAEGLSALKKLPRCDGERSPWTKIIIREKSAVVLGLTEGKETSADTVNP